MVLCQQQQTMKKNSILSKHAKAGSRGLMFFRYNNQTILVPQECTANFSFERRERMVGLGSDGMKANKRLYELEKEEIGDHLVLIP